MSHLAPFVQISREKFQREVRREMETTGVQVSDDIINEIAELRVKREIKQGVQTIQYQVITLMTRCV